MYRARLGLEFGASESTVRFDFGEANNSSLGTSIKTNSIPPRRVVGRPSSCRTMVLAGVDIFEFTSLLPAESLKVICYSLWALTASTQKSIGSRR